MTRSQNSTYNSNKYINRFSYVKTHLSTKKIVKNYIPLNVFGIPLIWFLGCF